MVEKETIVKFLLRGALRTTFKFPSAYPLPTSLLRDGMEMGARLFQPHPQCTFQSIVLGNVHAESIAPRLPPHRAILHYHGGAFFAGSSRTHRALGSEIAVRSRACVYMLDYRLAPEHAYPAALEDGLMAYQALLDKGYQPEDIVLGGDSGGCAHILNLAIALRDAGRPLPASLYMISPFLDMTLSSPSVRAFRKKDPMVTRYALLRGADGHRGHLPATDPRVSPLMADLRSLPPILVQTGGDEILLDDALRLKEMAQRASVKIECQIYQGLWHNFQMFNRFLQSADRALDEIGRFIHSAPSAVEPHACTDALLETVNAS